MLGRRQDQCARTHADTEELPLHRTCTLCTCTCERGHENSDDVPPPSQEMPAIRSILGSRAQNLSGGSLTLWQVRSGSAPQVLPCQGPSVALSPAARGAQRVPTWALGAGDSWTDIYPKKRFAYLWTTKMAAVLRGKPLIFSPQTIGPFSPAVFHRRSRFPE